MTNLLLRVERAAPFESAQGALGPLTALSAALGSATDLGGLWTRFRGALLALDADTLELLLAENRSARADRPGQPTYTIPLNVLPAGAGEIGTVSVTIRRDALPPTPAGLTVVASLAEASFDTSADALLRLIEACVEAVSADRAALGPRAWVRQLGAGWATFGRHLHRDLLPAGAKVVPIRSGSLVIAHTESPSSESALSRESTARVHDALRVERWFITSEVVAASATPAPSPSPAPATQTAALARFATELGPSQPTFSSRGTPKVLLETEPLSLDFRASVPLPFGRPPPPVTPQSIGAPSESPRLGGRKRPAIISTGTARALDIPRGPDLPFAKSPSGEPSPRGMASAHAVSPELTLEQYAHLRAYLTVRGEEDLETWTRFGVTSRSAKDALQARFAERFRQDPEAQGRFVEQVQRLSREIREKGSTR